MVTMKRLGVAAFAFASITIGSSSPSQASDHIDGLKTALDNSADITDVFTFVSPNDPNKLVLIMNVHTLAIGGSKFSNAVDYKFRIRPIANAQTLAPSTDPSKEQIISCSFSGGSLFNSNQRATCTFLFGSDSRESITFDTRGPSFYAGGSGERNGIKVFAGVRSDPWFLDLGKTVKLNGGHQVSQGPGANGLWGQNILSIAIELDKDRLNGPLLAVTAQTVRK